MKSAKRASGVILKAAGAALPALLLAACIGQPAQRIIVPTETVGARFQDWADPLDVWQIVESRQGPGGGGLPRWVHYFYAREIEMIEDMERFIGRYVFIARNQGGNLGALRQWANNFCPELDFVRLVVSRAEQRFVAQAALYPDDEYGEFFMRAIRKISDGEFPGAVKDDTFWVRREKAPRAAGGGAFGGAFGAGYYYYAQAEEAASRYEYLVLLSISKAELQGRIRQMLADVRTTAPPTREQAAAVSNIRQNFFEGF